MKIETIIGLIAGMLTTIAFIPQVLKVYKTKHTKDLAGGMFACFALGVFLWLIYGIMIRETPIILANSISFFLVLLIVMMMRLYRKNT